VDPLCNVHLTYIYSHSTTGQASSLGSKLCSKGTKRPVLCPKRKREFYACRIGMTRSESRSLARSRRFTTWTPPQLNVHSALNSSHSHHPVQTGSNSRFLTHSGGCDRGVSVKTASHAIATWVIWERARGKESSRRDGLQHAAGRRTNLNQAITCIHMI
jgi:hypothetical protein